MWQRDGNANANIEVWMRGNTEGEMIEEWTRVRGMTRQEMKDK